MTIKLILIILLAAEIFLILVGRDLILKLGSEICEGVQLYSLTNFDENNGAKFQQMLDYAGELVK